MAHGVKTAAVARALAVELNSQGLDVLFDHGRSELDSGGNLGKLRSWFGSTMTRDTILADLDIAIVLRRTNQVIALIEIEETTTNPKLLLGDALAALLGGHITFQGRELLVGHWTTLIILGYGRKQNRIEYLEEQVNRIKTILATPNAKIGRVVMNSFQSELELGQKLRKEIQTATARSGLAVRRAARFSWLSKLIRRPG